MFAKCIPHWCTVDVKDDSGELRRGMIRGHVRFQGIVVNFDYPGHYAEFVPFDRCENQWSYGYSMQAPVLALHQRAPDQPWRWYPTKVLAGTAPSCAFIETDFGDAVVREVLPLYRLRLAGKDDRIVSGRRVVKDFHQHAMRFSDWRKFPNDFLDIWERVTETKALKFLFDEGILVYAHHDDEPLGYRKMAEFNRVVSLKCHATAEKEVPRGIKRSASDENIPKINPDQTTDPHDTTFGHIAGEIIKEIVAYFNVEDQMKFRVVCRLWNFVITPIINTSRLEIDISNSEYQQLATRLQRKITTTTKILILSGGKDAKEAPKIRAVRIVVSMLKALNIKVPLVVLSGVAVIASDVLDNWYSVDFDPVHHPKWREVCGKLLLRDVVVWLPFLHIPALRIVQAVLDVQVDVGAERLLEKWCPELSRVEMMDLEKKVRVKWQHKRSGRSLWMLLTKLESTNDPNNRIDPEDYHPDDFRLDAESLSSLRKLTVWALKLRCS